MEEGMLNGGITRIFCGTRGSRWEAEHDTILHGRATRPSHEDSILCMTHGIGGGVGFLEPRICQVGVSWTSWLPCFIVYFVWRIIPIDQKLTPSRKAASTVVCRRIFLLWLMRVTKLTLPTLDFRLTVPWALHPTNLQGQTPPSKSNWAGGRPTLQPEEYP